MRDRPLLDQALRASVVKAAGRSLVPSSMVVLDGRGPALCVTGICSGCGRPVITAAQNDNGFNMKVKRCGRRGCQ